MALTRRILIAGLLLATAGCGWIEPDFLMREKRVENVRETADWYAANLRWGRIQQAAAMVQPDHRRDFIAIFVQPTPRVEFTGWEVITVEQQDLRSEAEVWVTYEYFTPPAVRPRSITERQQWRYDPVGRAWRVQPDLTVFPMFDPAKLERDDVEIAQEPTGAE